MLDLIDFRLSGGIAYKKQRIRQAWEKAESSVYLRQDYIKRCVASVNWALFLKKRHSKQYDSGAGLAMEEHIVARCLYAL